MSCSKIERPFIASEFAVTRLRYFNDVINASNYYHKWWIRPRLNIEYTWEYPLHVLSAYPDDDINNGVPNYALELLVKDSGEFSFKVCTTYCCMTINGYEKIINI